MNKLQLGLLALIAFIPLPGNAQVQTGDLPDNTVWYMHADLEAMRTGEAGSAVYAWFEDEVVEEVREETGIDLSDEVDSLTAFSNTVDGTVIIVNGPMTKATQDKFLALAAQEGPVDPREHDGDTYYFFGDEDDIENFEDHIDGPFEDFEDAVFVSFAVKGKALGTSTEGPMQDLLDNNGEVSGTGRQAGRVRVGLIWCGDDSRPESLRCL